MSFQIVRRDLTLKNLKAKNIEDLISNVTNQCPIEIGENAVAFGPRTIAIGCDSRAETLDSIAIGDNSRSSSGSTAVGPGAEARNYLSSAFGAGSIATGFYSVAIGSGSDNVIPNSQARASDNGSIAIGTGANSSGNYIAVGSTVAPLNIDAVGTITQSNRLLVRINNSANLYAIPLELTTIPA
jgi:hypothetical protein